MPDFIIQYTNRWISVTHYHQTDIMKKFLLLGIILLALNPGIWAQKWTDVAASSFDSGNGSITEPYIIKTPEQFAYLAQKVNGGETYLNKYFRLDADIDLNGKEWVPIGTSVYIAFKGKFDGNNKEITNLTIDYHKPDEIETEYVGLFGFVNDATLENIHIKSGSIKARQKETASGYSSHVGAVTGFISGTFTLSNCTNHATITAGTIPDKNIYVSCYVGGIAGYCAVGFEKKMNILNCINYGDIVCGDCRITEAGGILGYLWGAGIMKDCSNSGAVTGGAGEGSYTGGLIASASYAEKGLSISNCSNSGNVTGNSASETGGRGITGSCTGGLIAISTCSAYTMSMRNCINTGDVTGGTQSTGNAYVGGIIGKGNHSNTSIDYCFNEGNVTGGGIVPKSTTTYSYTGGLIGKEDGGGVLRLSKSGNSGTVTGGSGVVSNLWDREAYYYTGGLIGNIQSLVPYETCGVDMQDCSNNGTVESISTINSSTGGLVGYMSSGSTTKQSTVSMYRCYNYEAVTVAQGAKGALVGTMGRITANGSFQVISCYWRQDDGVNATIAGIGEGDDQASTDHEVILSTGGFKTGSNFDKDAGGTAWTDEVDRWIVGEDASAWYYPDNDNSRPRLKPYNENEDPDDELSDATLSSITISPGSLSPAFSKDVTTYSVSIPASTAKITITATPANSAAKVSGTGEHNLYSSQSTTFPLTVTASDGVTKKTYVVNVFRDGQTSTPSLDKIEYRLYPNPVKAGAQVTIWNQEQISGETLVEIFDIRGRLVRKIQLGAQRFFWAPGQSGVFYIRITKGDASVTQKIVVE